MNILKKLPTTIIGSALAIILPFVVITLITSKTPALFDVRSFVVLTGSMEPVFPVGSIVYAHHQQAYTVGDVITFKTAGNQNVTHRVHSVSKRNNETSYITKGDANNTVDSLPVKSSQIVGKVFFFVPYIGNLTNFSEAFQYAFTLIILISLAFIAYEKINKRKDVLDPIKWSMIQRFRSSVSSGKEYLIDFK